MVFDPNTSGFSFTLKEGCNYSIKLGFYVQREIVSCLSYANYVYKMGVRVDKSQVPVGSFGPSKNKNVCTIEEGVAPSGMLGRGHYTAKAKLSDDDKNVHLAVEYSFGMLIVHFSVAIPKYYLNEK